MAAMTSRENANLLSCVIAGLRLIPRDSVDRDLAAMLDDQTKEANEKSFVACHQTSNEMNT